MSKHVPRSFRGRLAHVLLAAILAWLVAPARPAAARPAPGPVDPITAAQREATRLSAQLDAQGTALERAAEKYNAAQQAAAEAATRSALAEADVVAAMAYETAARTRLRKAAVDSYISAGEGHLPATLGAVDGNQYTVRRHYVEVITGAHAHALQDLVNARAARQRAADASRRAAADARSAADDAKAAADAAAAAQTQTQATLTLVQGELADLVAAQQAAQEGAARAAWLAAHQPPAAVPPPPAVPGAPAPAAAPGTPVVVPGAAPGAPPMAVPAPLPGAATAIAAAKAQLGKPYLWGGNGPDSFDCSGLTLWAWRAAGVLLPRVAVDQKAATVPVSFDQLAPGDLVFYGDDTHHVGLYVGNETMINAPHTGDVVRYSSIWWPDLAGFGRVIR